MKKEDKFTTAPMNPLNCLLNIKAMKIMREVKIDAIMAAMELARIKKKEIVVGLSNKETASITGERVELNYEPCGGGKKTFSIEEVKKNEELIQKLFQGLTEEFSKQGQKKKERRTEPEI